MVLSKSDIIDSYCTDNKEVKPDGQIKIKTNQVTEYDGIYEIQMMTRRSYMMIA